LSIVLAALANLILIAAVTTCALSLASYSRSLVGRVVCGLVLVAVEAVGVIAGLGWNSAFLFGQSSGGVLFTFLLSTLFGGIFFVLPMYLVAIDRLDTPVAKQRDREIAREYRRMLAEETERRRRIALAESAGTINKPKRGALA
jgi:hypothetical protein